ncbi:hypothetical protein OSB04_017834 [Centaurea solstitialis]|uniref:Uncharacterized protein n=1 Tax=Centaurea solstitialis TaxID=347529 RepID=A0AA38WL43_9ASTR|nr:hypothetical protein OSB04_017834 [Centaurea solstitialis]
MLGIMCRVDKPSDYTSNVTRHLRVTPVRTYKSNKLDETQKWRVRVYNIFGLSHEKPITTTVAGHHQFGGGHMTAPPVPVVVVDGNQTKPPVRWWLIPMAAVTEPPWPNRIQAKPEPHTAVAELWFNRGRTNQRGGDGASRWPRPAPDYGWIVARPQLHHQRGGGGASRRAACSRSRQRSIAIRLVMVDDGVDQEVAA